MKMKLRKAVAFLKRLTNAFCGDCTFSVKLAVYRFTETFFGRLGMKKVSLWATRKKHNWIMAFLKKQMQSVLDDCAEHGEVGVFHENAPIWVCWWTGEESAPPLVKKCISSVRNNAGSHPVNLITQDNYSDYVTIPGYILEKLQNKTMCVANFSDYLRFSLLEKHGGLWLDATIFCSAPIPESYFALQLYTCKGGYHSEQYISDYRWTSFCFGGHEGNALFHFFCRAFELYWSNNDSAVDYLLVDYLINLAYEQLPIVRYMMDRIPENNFHRDDLATAMNAGLPAKQFTQGLHEDTIFYKLSWRETYPEKTIQGEDTVFCLFLK